MKLKITPVHLQYQSAGKLTGFSGMMQGYGPGFRRPEAIRMPDTGRVRFTDLEMEVLYLIMDGYADEKIAERLMENQSVIHATHRNLLFKMEVHNDAMLVREAFRGGYVW